MKSRTLLFIGLGLLITGSTVHWTASDFARTCIQRDASGSVWTTDAHKKESISLIGDRISLLGVGLMVVGAFGWMNAAKENAM